MNETPEERLRRLGIGWHHIAHPSKPAEAHPACKAPKCAQEGCSSEATKGTPCTPKALETAHRASELDLPAFLRRQP